MSIAEQSALYRERTVNVSSHEAIDRALSRLAEAKSRWGHTPLDERIGLVQASIEGVARHAEEWVEAACGAKGLAAGDPARGEEVLGGPLATLRYLRLLLQTLQDIQSTGKPRLPGKVSDGPGRRLRVEVFPARGMFDTILFRGLRAESLLKPGVTREQLEARIAPYYRTDPTERKGGISVVLGAGNVASIPPTDALTKLFHDGKVVLLKMNPVNEYLGPIFEKAFAALIDSGLLAIVYGGAEVGSYAIAHNLVDEVHITGSVYSHQSIVWGPPGEERERRIAAHEPLLKKNITSELGNVTPWIIAPGEYTERQLRFQAENLASTIANNASFNCVATKVIVTHKGWGQRELFLDMLEDVLDAVPPRKAYYPGAEQRFERFAGCAPGGCPPGVLPWKLIRDADPDRDSRFFEEESFVCVYAETALEARDDVDFLHHATEFVNERLWGTLGASLMLPPALRRRADGKVAVDQMLADLRYGTVAINYWSALSFALMSPAWGGFPTATLEDPQSGIDWVHNTFMLPDVEKTVVEGPITMWPKPLWMPTNRASEEVGWKVVKMYEQPSVWKIPSLLISALKG